MATRSDLDFTYSLTDRIFRLSAGKMADFSGAKYDGDFSLTLEQAQQHKHDYIVEPLRIEAGSRVLDLGCGWGAVVGRHPPPRRRGRRGDVVQGAGGGVSASRAGGASARRSAGHGRQLRAF